jgi:hypothetical protein
MSAKVGLAGAPALNGALASKLTLATTGVMGTRLTWATAGALSFELTSSGTTVAVAKAPIMKQTPPVNMMKPFLDFMETS